MPAWGKNDGDLHVSRPMVDLRFPPLVPFGESSQNLAPNLEVQGIPAILGLSQGDEDRMLGTIVIDVDRHARRSR